MRHSSKISVTQTLISVALTQTKPLLVSACRLPATHLWKRSRTRPLNAALLVITTKQKTKQKQSQAQVKHQLLLTIMKLRVASRFTAQVAEVHGSCCSTWLLLLTSLHLHHAAGWGPAASPTQSPGPTSSSFSTSSCGVHRQERKKRKKISKSLEIIV